MKKENSNLQFWERVAHLYTPFVEKGNKKMYGDLCNNIRPYLTKDMKVLELACGTGQLTLSLCEDVREWYATDFSQKMIDELNKRSLSTSLHCELQDATNLTYPDHQFDVVIIANALHIMPNPNQALKEINRVLKDDGILIAPTFIHEAKTNRIKIWLMERIGFITFHKWTSSQFKFYIISQGFEVISHSILYGNLFPECVIIARKKVS